MAEPELVDDAATSEGEAARAPQPPRVTLRVECVIRRDRVSPHHRIRAIGGEGRDRRRWQLSEEAAIAAIENDRASFYVEQPKGHRIEVVVGQGLGKTFLKTERDGDSPDVLLGLPDCS